MELTEKQVIEIRERLLAIQELVADIDEVLSATPASEEKPVEEEYVQDPLADEEPEEVEPEGVTIEQVIEEQGLADMSEDELKEVLDAYEIKYTSKNKKQSLMEKVAQGIIDGVIETSEEASEEVQETVEETADLTPRQEAEKAILEEIAMEIESKKLTKKTASAWLKDHFTDECKECPKGCKDDPIECYKAVKVAFVDDEGNVYGNEEAYIRDDAVFCCGVECEEDGEGKASCTVCGQVWEFGEE